jgi:hypothetical protein
MVEMMYGTSVTTKGKVRAAVSMAKKVDKGYKASRLGPLKRINKL